MVTEIKEGDKLLVTKEFKELYPTSRFIIGDELTVRYEARLGGYFYGVRSDNVNTLLVHGDVDLRMKQAWEDQNLNE